MSLAEPAPRARLLVVDDVVIVRRLVARTLSEVFDVIDAQDGHDALGKLRDACRVDLILTDIEMPELDGFGLFAALRDEHPKLAQRTVFMSGNATDPRIEARARELGRPLLSKTVAAGTLKETLCGLLRSFERRVSGVVARG